MRALIVSKTRMKVGLCVGAISARGQALRLLTSGGGPQPATTRFAIGQSWELTVRPKPGLIPPHTEDVLVLAGQFLSAVHNVREILLRLDDAWRGGPRELFDGNLRWTTTGKGYISRAGAVPTRSTGFWIPDCPLRYQRYQYEQERERASFLYAGSRARYCLPYVGHAPETQDIPAGALVRVSLARWWARDGVAEQQCYLQLSGWYR